MLENENFLVEGGLIKRGRSNSNHSSLSEMWELQCKSQGVENFTGAISQFKFISVFIKLEDLKDLSNNIEVTRSLGGILECSDIAVSNHLLSEDSVGPLEEGLEDSFILSLLGGFVA